jgi:hypothetical protein
MQVWGRLACGGRQVDAEFGVWVERVFAVVIHGFNGSNIFASSMLKMKGLLQNQSKQTLRDKLNRRIGLFLVIEDHGAGLRVESNKALAFNLTTSEYH